MTLCIAAISRKQPSVHIVTVSDLMLSSAYMSTETRITKAEPLTPSRRWVVMFAGSPTPIGSVIRGVMEKLDGSQESETDVRVAVEAVYRDELRKKIEAEILSPFGLDRPTFLTRGREYFGEQEFARLNYEMSSCRLGLELLVAGFEPSGWPRIFSITDPGVFSSHDRLGFHAIGSGWMGALGSLYTNYEATLSKPELIYRVCEAKFLGESASGVGKRTYVLTFTQEPAFQTLWPDDVDRVIRPEWELHGKPQIPEKMPRQIDEALRNTGWGAPNVRPIRPPK
jgi:hypothetical protein